MVLYDPGSRISIIRAYNEYGDSAYLNETMKETRRLVRSIWTGETVILEGDKVWEWSKMSARMIVLAPVDGDPRIQEFALRPLIITYG